MGQEMTGAMPKIVQQEREKCGAERGREDWDKEGGVG